MALELGAAYISILPSTDKLTAGIKDALKDSERTAATQGKKSGGRFSAGFKSALKGAAIGLGAVVTAGGAFLKTAIADASDLEETMSKANTVFGKQAGDIQKWSKSASTALGMSRKEALDAASTFGNFFDQIGFGNKVSAEMSKRWVRMSADLASFHNANPVEVQEALAAATRGEYDSLQKYIPTINAAKVEQKALAMTGKENAKALTDQEKAAAVYQLTLKGQGKANGDFARTQGSLANQTKIAKAQFADFRASLGKALLPLVTRFMRFLNKEGMPVLRRFGRWFKADGIPALKQFGGWVKTNVLPVLGSIGGFIKNRVLPPLFRFGKWLFENKPVVLGIVAAFATYKTVMFTVATATRAVTAAKTAWTAVTKTATGVQAAFTAVMNAGRRAALGTRIQLIALRVQTLAVTAVQKAWIIVQKALNLAMRMNPIGMIVTALTLLVGGLILAYKKSDTFRKIVDKAWAGIKKGIGVAWDFIKKVFVAVKDWLTKTLSGAFNRIKRVATVVWNGIKKVIGIWWKGVKTYFRLVRAAIKVLANVFKWLWKNIVLRAFDGIKKIIKMFWNGLKFYFNLAKKGIRALGDVFRWIRDKIIRPVFNKIKEIIATWWNNLRNNFNRVKNFIGDIWNGIKNTAVRVWGNIKNRILNFVDRLRDGFRRGMDGIKKIWDRLKAAARKPVEFLVNTVYMKGIRRMMNKIPGVNLPEASFARGGVMPGYTPGRDIHTFFSPTAGRLNLSGGEAIMRPEFTRAVGGKKGVERLNAMARRGLSFFMGGVLPLMGGSVSTHTSGYSGYAADMNYPGYADYGKPVRAWKAGTVGQMNYIGDSSYGRWVVLNHGGQSSLYAHLSRFAGINVGQRVGAGQTVGYVGDLGNTGTPPTSHLHFEINGGNVPQGANRPGGPTPRTQARSTWWDAITNVPDMAKNAWNMIKNLGSKFGPWGRTFKDAATAVLRKSVNWVDDKIPNRFLPDTPVYSALKGLGIFDNGGVLKPGQFAYNASTKPEAVFNHQQFRKFAEGRGTANQFPSRLILDVDGEQFNAYVRDLAADEIDAERDYQESVGRRR